MICENVSNNTQKWTQFYKHIIITNDDNHVYSQAKCERRNICKLNTKKQNKICIAVRIKNNYLNLIRNELGSGNNSHTKFTISTEADAVSRAGMIKSA